MDYKDKKLNILQVHNYYREAGGEDVVVKNEAKMLKKHGHRVFGYYRRNEEIGQLSFVGKIMLPMDSLFSIRTYSQIRRIIREKKIDLVHVHNTLHLISPSVFYAAKKEGVPVVMTVHNYRLCCPNGMFYTCHHVCERCMHGGLKNAVAYRCYRHNLYQSAMQAFNTYLHRQLHTYKDVSFICLTEFQKNKICALSDIVPEHVFLKPNFIDTKVLANANRKNQFLYVGRLEEEKGIWDLLKAYHQMVLDMPKSGCQIPELVICGEGSQYSECCRFVKEKGLKKVFFAGQVSQEEVLHKMAHSRCVVIPSRWYEGMPMVLVEAYRTKTPVVTPDLGAFLTLVEDGVNGFKYRAHDIGALAALLSMMSAKAEDMICSFSKQDILEKTEYEANYAQLMNIYERCIGHVWNSEEESAAGK